MIWPHKKFEIMLLVGMTLLLFSPKENRFSRIYIGELPRVDSQTVSSFNTEFGFDYNIDADIPIDDANKAQLKGITLPFICDIRLRVLTSGTREVVSDQIIKTFSVWETQKDSINLYANNNWIHLNPGSYIAIVSSQNLPSINIANTTLSLRPNGKPDNFLLKSFIYLASRFLIAIGTIGLIISIWRFVVKKSD